LRASQINDAPSALTCTGKICAPSAKASNGYMGSMAGGSPYYTERERAALAWTEAVTNIREGHAPDGNI